MDGAVSILPPCCPIPGFGGWWAFHEQIDRIRCWQGRALDAVGLGPIETPSRVVQSRAGLTLKVYEDEGDVGPVVLIVPAPIKRAYIWDLVPRASVVRRCLRAGARVYLIQWERPEAAEQGFGLAEYADRLILDCLDAIGGETGWPRAVLAGHSLGGTLAAIFSALHPERVQGLILLGAPLHFGPDVGALDRLVAIAPRAGYLTAVPGNIPGSFLNLVSILAAPMTFGADRWADWARSIPDPQAIDTHLRVERWTLDEMPLASRLFREVSEELYYDDKFILGRLMVGGRCAAPASVDAPLLSVLDARCPIAPPRSVLPFHHAVRSAETQLLWYEGDAGVALRHVGMLVGKSAHQYLWPQILHWIHARGKAGPGGEPAWVDRESDAPRP
jgi:polyhydroxyalkanoate synthase